MSPLRFPSDVIGKTYHCYILRVDLSFECAHKDCKKLRKLAAETRAKPVSIKP